MSNVNDAEIKVYDSEYKGSEFEKQEVIATQRRRDLQEQMYPED
jgi:hypothetical protein